MAKFIAKFGQDWRNWDPFGYKKLSSLRVTVRQPRLTAKELFCLSSIDQVTALCRAICQVIRKTQVAPSGGQSCPPGASRLAATVAKNEHIYDPSCGVTFDPGCGVIHCPFCIRGVNSRRSPYPSLPPWLDSSDKKSK